MSRPERKFNPFFQGNSYRISDSTSFKLTDCKVDLYYEQNTISPERRLLGAILARAVLDYCYEGGNPQNLNDKRKAKEFLENDNITPINGEFTYLFICDILEIDALLLRKTLQSLTTSTEEGLKKTTRGWLRCAY